MIKYEITREFTSSNLTDLQQTRPNSNFFVSFEPNNTHIVSEMSRICASKMLTLGPRK